MLNEHSGVAESAVVGVRVEDAGGEEEVKACIVVTPEANAPPEPTDVLNFCVPRMPC